MRVGDGVIIDASRLGMNGGQLVGVIAESDRRCGCLVELLREVEREMAQYGWRHVLVSPDEITATIPNQGHWLGKDMP